MKPERLEDLGRIRELLEKLLSDYDDLEADCTSRHARGSFVDKYVDEYTLCELHSQLRALFERLDEIKCIARGDCE